MKITDVSKTGVFETTQNRETGSQLGAADALAVRCAMAALDLLKAAAAALDCEVADLDEAALADWLGNR